MRIQYFIWENNWYALGEIQNINFSIDGAINVKAKNYRKIYVMVIINYNKHKFLNIIYMKIKYQSLKNKKNVRIYEF